MFITCCSTAALHSCVILFAAQKFDVAEHMGTAPEFLSRKHNIPRLKDLKENPITGPANDETVAVRFYIVKQMWIIQI